MANQYRHEITLVIRADKKCSKAEAVFIAKDSIHGEFYPYEGDTKLGVGKFKVVTIK